jgi:hypothetical protein
MDERLRQAERDGSADRLRREQNRAGQGKRLYMVDLLDQARVKPELSSIAVGVRAVLKALGIPARVRLDCGAVNVTPGGREGVAALRDYFEVKASSLHTLHPFHREARSALQTAGPRLAPEHQELFLDAVITHESKTPRARRQLRQGDVVKFRVRKRRRYVVSGADEHGHLSLVALSGFVKGSGLHGVEEDRLTLDKDQTVAFTGGNGELFRARYERQCARHVET